MGYVLTDEIVAAEPLRAEVRSESFYIGGPDVHGYPASDLTPQHGGTAEFLITDIPKIRLVLDAIEAHERGDDEVIQRVISVVKLPDGRYAVQNERDVSDLTADDEDQMASALMLWFDLRRRTR